MPLSYEEEIEIRREAVLELSSKGWTQQQIAQKLGYSQAQISKDLAVIRSKARDELTNHYLELPIRYRMVLSNLEQIRKEAWQTVANTQDARSKSVLFNTLIAVNREILDVIAAGDLIEQEVANAELIAKEAKEDLVKAKQKLAEQAGSKIEGKDPPNEGFDLENSISTTSSLSTSDTAPQEVLDSQGAIVLAKAEDSSRWEAEEEEKEDGNEDADAYAPPSSSTTADTIPSDTMHMIAYEVVSDDATVDSTVVKEEKREVVVDDSSSYSYDVEDDGDNEEQVGDHS